jgi:UDP-glucose 6-dehydrogenase
MHPVDLTLLTESKNQRTEEQRIREDPAVEVARTYMLAAIGFLNTANQTMREMYPPFSLQISSLLYNITRAELISLTSQLFELTEALRVKQDVKTEAKN